MDLFYIWYEIIGGFSARGQVTNLQFLEIALAAVCRMAIEERVEAGRLLRRYCSDPGDRGWWLSLGHWSQRDIDRHRVCIGDSVDKMMLIWGMQEGEESRLSPRFLI